MEQFVYILTRVALLVSLAGLLYFALAPNPEIVDPEDFD
jgi:hypothetical protein